jgi:hypothetical protein
MIGLINTNKWKVLKSSTYQSFLERFDFFPYKPPKASIRPNRINMEKTT